MLASGGGTNLQAILDHFAALGANAPAQVVLVVSDRAQAGTLDRARNAGIEAVHLKSPAQDAALASLLDARRIDVVALAGYLRLVPADVVRRWRGRIVNVHPALLPAFGGAGMYGIRVHRAVLGSGAKESGATVHFVDEEFDRGAVIEQTRVPVLPGDTAELLAERVLAVEHVLYPRVLGEVCARLRETSSGERVTREQRGQETEATADRGASTGEPP